MPETITAVLYCIIWGCDRFWPLPHSPDKKCWTTGYHCATACTVHPPYIIVLHGSVVGQHQHIWWMARCCPSASIVHQHIRCTSVWGAQCISSLGMLFNIGYPYQFASIYYLTSRLVVVMDHHLSWCPPACVIPVCHVCPSTSMTGYYDANNQFQCTTSSSQPHMLFPWNNSDQWWMPVNHNSMYPDAS